MSIPTMLNGVSTNPQLAGPLGDCQAFAVPFNPMGKIPVAILLKGIRPSAIAGSISKHIVDAINGISIWAWSHIGVKVHEGITPSLGHDQPFRAVTMKHRGVWVVAALKHRGPDTVFTSFVHAVRGAGHSDGFTALASARLRACFQVMPAHTYCVSTSAGAFPPHAFMGAVPFGLFYSVKNGKHSKCASGQIDNWASHNTHTSMIQEETWR